MPTETTGASPADQGSRTPVERPLRTPPLGGPGAPGPGSTGFLVGYPPCHYSIITQSVLIVNTSFKSSIDSESWLCYTVVMVQRRVDVGNGLVLEEYSPNSIIRVLRKFGLTFGSITHPRRVFIEDPCWTSSPSSDHPLPVRWRLEIEDLPPTETVLIRMYTTTGVVVRVVTISPPEGVPLPLEDIVYALYKSSILSTPTFHYGPTIPTLILKEEPHEDTVHPSSNSD